jgi:sulfur carrier protein
MQLTVNGKPATIAEKELDIPALLEELKVPQPEYVTVELNGEILDRESFGITRVRNGDTIEFLYFMGGGRASFAISALIFGIPCAARRCLCPWVPRLRVIP